MGEVIMRDYKVAKIFIIIGVAMLYGCSATKPTVSDSVKYGNATDVEQVTTEFGSTDLQMIAESMARSLAQSAAGYKEKPLVTMADVKNKTDEYIDTRSVTDSIKTQLLKSGSMRFATDIADMQNQTDELARQNNSGLYKKSSTAKVGEMQGAQYRIEGSLTSIVKKNSSVKDVYYKFTLRMTNIESGTTEWMDEKEIRKSASR
jgi:penicillin-binding protein activator